MQERSLRWSLRNLVEVFVNAEELQKEKIKPNLILTKHPNSSGTRWIPSLYNTVKSITVQIDL
jgi:hypothetical protein